MKNIFDIFTSKSRAMMLRTLYFQKQAVPLRHLSEISGLPVFSVQNAIGPLLGEGLISRVEENNNVLIELNREHRFYSVVEQIFVAEMNARISLEAASYCQKARRSLKFAAAANVILRRVRRRKH